MRGDFFTETNNQKHHVYYQYTTANVLSSLNVLAYGHDICTPRSPVIGPVRRPFYCIHYILWGSGEYTVNHTHYRLEPGTIFFIPMGYNKPVKVAIEGDNVVVTTDQTTTKDCTLGLNISMYIGIDSIVGSKFGVLDVSED